MITLIMTIGGSFPKASAEESGIRGKSIVLPDADKECHLMIPRRDEGSQIGTLVSKRGTVAHLSKIVAPIRKRSYSICRFSLMT